MLGYTVALMQRFPSPFPRPGLQGFLEGVKITVKAGLDAANSLAQLGMGGIIDIKYAYFEVDLNTADGGFFACRIDASFFDAAPKTLNIKVDFRDLFSAAKELANEAFDGISSLL